jgi:hypothetical protein
MLNLELCMLTCSHAHHGAFHGHLRDMLGGSPEDIEAHEAHLGAVEAHRGALCAHPRDLEAHPEALHVHLGPFSFRLTLGPGMLTLNP